LYFSNFILSLVNKILSFFFFVLSKVSISVELQYFIIQEDLKLLHDAYDIYYEKIIEDNAKDALKVTFMKFDG
jgi:hypothetical protein